MSALVFLFLFLFGSEKMKTMDDNYHLLENNGLESRLRRWFFVCFIFVFVLFVLFSYKIKRLGILTPVV